MVSAPPPAASVRRQQERPSMEARRRKLDTSALQVGLNQTDLTGGCFLCPTKTPQRHKVDTPGELSVCGKWAHASVGRTALHRGQSWTTQACRCSQCSMWIIGEVTMPSVRTALLYEVHVNFLLPQGSAERNGPCRALKMHYNDHVLISGAEARCAAGKSQGPLLHVPVPVQSSSPMLNPAGWPLLGDTCALGPHAAALPDADTLGNRHTHVIASICAELLVLLHRSKISVRKCWRTLFARPVVTRLVKCEVCCRATCGAENIGTNTMLASTPNSPSEPLCRSKQHAAGKEQSQQPGSAAASPSALRMPLCRGATCYWRRTTSSTRRWPRRCCAAWAWWWRWQPMGWTR